MSAGFFFNIFKEKNHFTNHLCPNVVSLFTLQQVNLGYTWQNVPYEVYSALSPLRGKIQSDVLTI